MPDRISNPVSILMPLSNEAQVIREVITEWYQEVIQFLPAGSELIIDEAGSVDDSKRILAELCTKYSFLKVFNNEKKEGFGVSARRLYDAASCPWVFFTDSDGQYVAKDFWKLTPFMHSCGIVHGVKGRRQDPIYRLVASWGFNFICRLVFRTRYTDINSAFRLIRRDVVQAILPEVHSLPTLFNAELLLLAAARGVKIEEIPVGHRSRKSGGSRGLPLSGFLIECVKALRGVRELRKRIHSA